jgi:hypothetical protein
MAKEIGVAEIYKIKMPLMQKVYTKKLLLKRMKKWTSLLIN